MSRTEAVSGKRATERAAEGANARAGAVFWRTMQDNLPAILGWGLGYGVLLGLGLGLAR